MPRIVRCSLIQATNAVSPDRPLEQIKRAMIDKHVDYIEKAAADGAQIILYRFRRKTISIIGSESKCQATRSLSEVS